MGPVIALNTAEDIRIGRIAWTMWATFKQNLIFIFLIALSVNVLVLSSLSIVRLLERSKPSQFDIIDCADGASRVRKCIRIDATAGEVNDATKGASYRVIYGY